MIPFCRHLDLKVEKQLDVLYGDNAKNWVITLLLKMPMGY